MYYTKGGYFPVSRKAASNNNFLLHFIYFSLSGQYQEKCMRDIEIEGYRGIESIGERIEKKIEAVKKRRYFIPRELDECNKLIPELEEVIKDYKNALKPWYKTSWKAAFNAGKKAAREVKKVNREVVDLALEIARDTANDALLEVVWYYLPEDDSEGGFLKRIKDLAKEYKGVLKAYKVVGEITRYVFLDITWEVARDIKGYENNPFEKIVKIYDMGLYQRGFRKVDGMERFIVDFPLKTYELGCWAEGDKEILYKHMWHEDCSKIRPVKPLRIIE